MKRKLRGLLLAIVTVAFAAALAMPTLALAQGDGAVGADGDTVPTGTITPGYTSTEGKIWGEGGGNASESLVVKLYSGEALLATATLNNIDGIIDGDVYVTWNIPFADSTDDTYWTVDWVADGYNVNAMGTTVEMWIDDVKVAENDVRLNAPDDLNKIVAVNAADDGTIQGCYTTLAAAIEGQDDETAQTTVMRDITEDLAGKTLAGKIVSGVEGGVSITNTDADDYTYIEDLTIGSGVTFKALGAYFKDGESFIEGDLIVTEEGINSAEDAVLYQGYDSKVTVQNGGTVAVNGSLMIRYNTDETAGLYIYGDDDDATVELTVTRYYIGAYSGTFHAEDAVIEANYILLDHEQEPDTYPAIELELDNTAFETGSVTAIKDASISLANSSVLDVEGDFAASDTVTIEADATSNIVSSSEVELPDVEISNAADLAAALANNRSVILTEDIDLTPAAGFAGWSTVAAYSGTLDGNGKSIKGLTAPLFNKITDATIQNLTVEANISTTASDAAAIALLTGGTTAITNVTVKGSVSGGADVDNDLSKNGGAAGFIVRAAGNLTIENCVNEATVTGVDRKAAGFVSSNGTAASGDVITIKDSVNNGAISANRSNTTTNAYEVYAAGIIAWNGAKGITVNIEDCTNNGAISGVREAVVEGYSTVAAGGIIGTCWNGAGITTTLTNVTNTGNVTATNNGPDHNAYAAGVIGLTNPSSNTFVKSAAVSGTIKAVVNNEVGYATVGGVTAQTNNSQSVINVERADVSAATYVTEGGSAQYKGAVVGHHGGDDASLTYDETSINSPAGMKMVGNVFDGESIYDLSDLKAFRDAVNGGDDFSGKTVTLLADIDLGGEGWTPIGSSDSPFRGTFDGGDSTISNLVVNSEGSHAGLFGKADGATLKNVDIVNANVSGASYVGALAGETFTGAVEDCSVSGRIVVEGNYKVGGLVGSSYASIANCSVTGDGEDTSSVTGVYVAADLEGDNVGGIAGFLGEDVEEVEGCSVSDIKITGTRKVGGVAGSAYPYTDITDAFVAEVTVGTNATSEYAESKADSMGVGGIVGLYTANDEGVEAGSLTGVVEGVTLVNANGVDASMGYVTGGLRTSESDPIEPGIEDADVKVAGENSGENNGGMLVTSAHKVTLPASQTGYTVSQTGEAYIDSGEEFTFTVTAADGYEIVSVKAGGQTLAGNQGAYSFTVTDDVTIEIVARLIPTYGPSPSLPDTGSDDDGCADDAACNAFDDVDEGAWYHEVIDWAVAEGVLRGYVGADGNLTGKLGPLDELQRAQLLAMLHRIEGEPVATAECTFSDVADGAWYAGVMAWAQEEGLIMGDEGRDTVRPTDDLTREELAVILWRWAEWKGLDVSEGEDADVLSYADADQISSWAMPAVQWAVAEGVISGYTDANGEPTGCIGPKDTAERAQVAAMLSRLDAKHGIL